MQCESFNHTTNAIAFAKVHKNCANRKQSAKNLFLNALLRCRQFYLKIVQIECRTAKLACAVLPSAALSSTKILKRYNRDITELQQ